MAYRADGLTGLIGLTGLTGLEVYAYNGLEANQLTLEANKADRLTS